MRFCFLSVFLCLAAGCGGQRALQQNEAPAAAVSALMTAFNAHDPDEMRAHWTNDVTWYEVSGDQMSIVTSSAEQLHGELVAYFEAYPDVSSRLESVAVNGNYVTAIERPQWKQEGVYKSQASVVVYEVIDGKVKRFWYYPPQ